MKKLLKKSMAALLAQPLLFKYLLSHSTTVLTFHRVLPDNARYLCNTHESIIIYQSQFDELLGFLVANFNVLSLTQFINKEKSRKSSRPEVVLTFDDGWRDNLIYALPILKKHGLKAALFVATDYMSSNKMFWWRIVESVLSHEIVNKQVVEILSRDTTSESLLSRIHQVIMGAERIALISELVGHMKGYNCNEIDDLAAKLLPFYQRNKFDEMMTWSDVQSWVDAGMEIGPHGKSHHLLTSLPLEDAEQEIVSSFQEINKYIDGEVLNGFCYPNGNHNKQLEAILMRHGFVFSLSAKKGLVKQGDTSLFSIPRINISVNSAGKPYLLAFKLVRAIFQ